MGRAVERIVTSPYPSFPTDLQSQVMVLLSLADGFSVMKETVFEGRFKHVDEHGRMGADIPVDLNCAFIRGVSRLYGATVEATDLRAGAALVIAGLAAQGKTVVEQVHHIDRGYDRIETMFGRLGARISRLSPESEQPIRPVTTIEFDIMIANGMGLLGRRHPAGSSVCMQEGDKLCQTRCRY